MEILKDSEMFNFIFENPAQTVEIASLFVKSAAAIFFTATAVWAINGIRKTDV